MHESEPADTAWPEKAPSILVRIPLPVRMIAYGASFLGLVLGALPAAAYRIDVHWPAYRIELGWLRIVGVVLFGTCFVVYVYASYVLASRGKGAYVEFDPPTQFVATGAHRWVRNPIAGSCVAMLLGEAIAFSSTGIFLLTLLAMGIAHVQVVGLEEPLLRKRFGRAYDDYVARVPRWIPRRPRKGSP